MRRIAAVCLLILTLACALAGCHPRHCHEDTLSDQLWRQGYGRNNPNVARWRDGEPPVDFDGEVRHPRTSALPDEAPTP